MCHAEQVHGYRISVFPYFGIPCNWKKESGNKSVTFVTKYKYKRYYTLNHHTCQVYAGFRGSGSPLRQNIQRCYMKNLLKVYAIVTKVLQQWKQKCHCGVLVNKIKRIYLHFYLKIN